MFQRITDKMRERMKVLEEMDSIDRENNTPRLQRLRQIPPETGKFLSLWAATAPEGRFIEIGTSAGYSTMWLSLACMELDKKITTFELLKEKHKLAAETFAQAGIEEYVESILGNAVELIGDYKEISFCFLDAEKDVYSQCYDKIIPNLVPGGILIADNAISHEQELAPFIDRVLNDERVDALVVPIGTGELLCRKR